MLNVSDVLRSQANAGEHATRRLSDKEIDALVLDRMNISAPATRSVLVQVYEPAQAQDQEEVIIEEFVLEGGMTEMREMRSATAAYRFLPLTLEQQQKLSLDAEKRAARAGDQRSAEALTVGQPGFLLPETHDEMATGEARLGQVQAAESDAEEERGKPLNAERRDSASRETPKEARETKKRAKR
jgi:hypothetical protein